MLKKTLVALCATSALLSAGAALADKPGAGWITIEKAIEVAKTKAGYVEVYAAEADENKFQLACNHHDGSSRRPPREVRMWEIRTFK